MWECRRQQDVLPARSCRVQTVQDDGHVLLKAQIQRPDNTTTSHNLMTSHNHNKSTAKWNLKNGTCRPRPGWWHRSAPAGDRSWLPAATFHLSYTWEKNKRSKRLYHHTQWHYLNKTLFETKPISKTFPWRDFLCGQIHYNSLSIMNWGSKKRFIAFNKFKAILELRNHVTVKQKKQCAPVKKMFVLWCTLCVIWIKLLLNS